MGPMPVWTVSLNCPARLRSEGRAGRRSLLSLVGGRQIPCSRPESGRNQILTRSGQPPSQVFRAIVRFG